MAGVLDVQTSALSLLIVGWLASLVGSFLRLPVIVPMILIGIALQPHVHPALLYAPVEVKNTDVYPPVMEWVGGEPAASGVARSGAAAAVSPAAAVRTIALLIALMRGGLSVKLSYFKEVGAPLILFATVPYTLELIAEALVAPVFLPTYFGPAALYNSSVAEYDAGLDYETLNCTAFTPCSSLRTPPMLVSFTAASVWAPLSPSIVIPNMMHFVEQGLTKAGRLVLTGGPLEVSTALVVEGVMAGVQTSLNAGGSSVTALGHIPVYVFGSVLYGVAFAIGFFLYTKLRGLHAVSRALDNSRDSAAPDGSLVEGEPEPVEARFVWVVIFVLCYTTSVDSTNTPWLIGFFSALCMAITTQYLQPAIADDICVWLKPVWYFAECFLFTLTGCVIRPAIDAGIALDLFGWFFAVLLVGTAARMVGDVLVGVVWHASLIKSSPGRFTREDWGIVARRFAFLWRASIPKATLQASLGPKLTTTFSAGGYISSAGFVAPSSAVSILYAASIGSMLTHTVGFRLAQFFQAHSIGDDSLSESSSPKGASPGGFKGVSPPSSPGGFKGESSPPLATTREEESVPTVVV